MKYTNGLTKMSKRHLWGMFMKNTIEERKLWYRNSFENFCWEMINIDKSE